MQTDGFAALAEVGKVLVDEERAVCTVEGTLAADEMIDFVDPGRMVDHSFKGFSSLVDLLQVEPVDRAVGMGVDVAVPVAWFQGWDRVEA